MRTHFVEQVSDSIIIFSKTQTIAFKVQLLMQAQQIKAVESCLTNGTYCWLRNTKSTLMWLSTKQEFLIRQALSKVFKTQNFAFIILQWFVYFQITQEQQQKVIKQLLKWLDDNPTASGMEIPGLCLNLLQQVKTEAMLHDVNLSRMSSFRNSLRRFSTLSNKVGPVTHLLPPDSTDKRRSVTFNDVPTVYSIPAN